MNKQLGLFGEEASYPNKLALAGGILGT